MHTYDDPRAAFAEMKRYNAIVGRQDYTVVATPDGFTVRRILPKRQRCAAYLKWKAAFLERESQMMCRRFIRTARRARA